MSTEKTDTKPAERLENAYNRMMERIKSALEDAEEHAIPTLEQNLKKAREKSVELGELTREEADKIGAYLKRDMDDAGQFLARTGSEFRAWLRTDIELIEDRLLDMFSSVADKTKLEWIKLGKDLNAPPSYHTGEVTAPGVLECTNCGEHLHFHATGHIPPCPKCHATEYRRVSEDADAE